MNPSQACVDLIRRFEGCRLNAYRDPAGLWTIGYGHASGVTPGMQINQAVAETLLRADVEHFAAEVSDHVQVPLTQGQFDGLVCWAFNCRGWRGSALIRLLNERQYAAAAAQFARWNHAGGQVLNGLTTRRKAEQQIFLS